LVGCGAPAAYDRGVPTRIRQTRHALNDALAGAETLDETVAAADAVLRSALGAESAAWGTIDPSTMLSTSCRLFGALDHGGGPLPQAAVERERRLFELEWRDDEPNTFWHLARSGRVAAALRLGVGEPMALARYRELLVPLGIHDELRLVLTVDESRWGTVIFYRSDAERFEAGEVEMAAECARVIAAALRRAMLRLVCDSAAVPSAPGAVLLDEHDAVMVTSPAAEELLASLEEHHVATVLVSLAASTRANGSTSIVVSGPGGPVALHGAPAKGTDGGVAVVVERPRPIELAPLIMQAMGFTARERVVAELLLSGSSRRQIGRRLAVSDHTVGDHLGQVYRKAGVASRGELAARLYGQFYEELRAAQTPPSPYGYFVGR
jgi:DNA-binding CsgD family transcriptional regulator